MCCLYVYIDRFSLCERVDEKSPQRDALLVGDYPFVFALVSYECTGTGPKLRWVSHDARVLRYDPVLHGESVDC